MISRITTMLLVLVLHACTHHRHAQEKKNTVPTYGFFASALEQPDAKYCDNPDGSNLPLPLHGLVIDGNNDEGDDKTTSSTTKNIFDHVSIAIHRNGDPEPCGGLEIVKSPSIVSLMEQSLSEMKLCNYQPTSVTKYHMETWLTNTMIHGFQQQHSEDPKMCQQFRNYTAPQTFQYYCDMGSKMTVIQNDHDFLKRVPGTNSLPCRFYTREGRRIDSMETLKLYAQKALLSHSASTTTTSTDGSENNGKASSSSCVVGPNGEESCTETMPDSERSEKSEETTPTLHVYAVPAGRMFMFAPSYVGEQFIIDHMAEDELPDIVSSSSDGRDSEESDESTPPQPTRYLIAEVISVKPRVFELYNFFTPDEATKIIDRALRDTSPTHGFHRSTTGAVNGQVFGKRTSENAWDTMGPEAKVIKKRCLKFLGFDEYWESHTDGLQILRYKNKQAYANHADYLDKSTGENYDYDSAGVGGNRFATILLYMSDLGETDGGETVFKYGWPADATEFQKQITIPQTIRELRQTGVIDSLEAGSWEEELAAFCKTRLAIQPRMGRAVLFYSQHPDGREDKNAQHGACPVLNDNSTKWAANLWVWSGPRAEFAKAPKLRPEGRSPAPAAAEVRAEFRNTGRNPTLFNADTKLCWGEDSDFGSLGPNDRPIVVNTFEGHVWNVKVDGKTVKSFRIGSTEQKYQKFEI